MILNTGFWKYLNAKWTNKAKSASNKSERDREREREEREQNFIDFREIIDKIYFC